MCVDAEAVKSAFCVCVSLSLSLSVCVVVLWLCPVPLHRSRHRSHTVCSQGSLPHTHSCPFYTAVVRPDRCGRERRMAEKKPTLGSLKLTHKTELKEWEKRKKAMTAGLKKLSGAEKQTAKSAIEKEESDLLDRCRSRLIICVVYACVLSVFVLFTCATLYCLYHHTQNCVCVSVWCGVLTLIARHARELEALAKPETAAPATTEAVSAAAPKQSQADKRRAKKEQAEREVCCVFIYVCMSFVLSIPLFVYFPVCVALPVASLNVCSLTPLSS